MPKGSEIGARRLLAQQIARPAFADLRDLVAWLGAVQAQDYAAVKWAVGLRLAGSPTEAEIEGAINEGTVLRIHALRGTWQLVAPADVRWILDLVASRTIDGAATRHRKRELDEATFRRSKAALRRALQGARPLTRGELGEALEAAGISTKSQRLAHLLQRAELEGLICGAARRGKQFTYALLEEWAPGPHARLDRDEALAELARRYFRSRGPATVDDFIWWSGLAPAEARAGLEAVRSSFASETVDGRTFWYAEETLAASRTPPAFLLPAFDEYLIAYRDRNAVLDPKYGKRLNAGGGMLDPCIVVNSRVLGTWRRTVGRSSVLIELDFFEGPTQRALRSVTAAARLYGAFLGLKVRLDH